MTALAAQTLIAQTGTPTAPYLEDAPGFSGTWSNYSFFNSGVIVVTSVEEGLILVKKRDQTTVF